MISPRRAILIALTILLLGSACSSAPTAEEKAAAREALLDTEVSAPRDESDPTQSAGTSEPVAGCDGEDCETEAQTGARRFDVATANIPEAIGFQLVAALELVDQAQAQCGDLAAWTAAMEEAAEAARTAAAAAASAGDWLGSPDALDVASELRDRLIMQRDCEGGATEGQEAEITAALAAAGRASAANDELQVALTAGNVKTGSEFWYHADQIGHAVELARLSRDAGGVDVLIVGASTGKRGFDPNEMTSQLGRSTMNASVAGMVPSVIPHWLVQSIQLGGTPSSVVIGVTPWQDLVSAGQPPCDDDTVARMTGALEQQAQAFAAVPILGEFESAVRLTGGPLATYDGPALDASNTYQPGERGWAETRNVVHGPGGDLARLYRSQLNGDSGCPRYLDAIGGLVDDLTASGTEVLLVSLPIHPEMSALIDRGAAAHQEVAAGYATMAESAGAGWLDLTDLLDENEFLDLTHANGPGQAKVTAATIEAMR